MPCRSYERTPVDEALNERQGDMQLLNLIASFQHDSTHKRATLPSLSADDQDRGATPSHEDVSMDDDALSAQEPNQRSQKSVASANGRQV